jgi:hypothetical protein
VAVDQVVKFLGAVNTLEVVLLLATVAEALVY